MNPNIPPSNASGDKFISSPINPGNRPEGMSPFTSAQQIRPMRMELQRPNGNYQQNLQQRPNGNYHQQNLQQQNYVMQQNHLRQQQPYPRPTNEDLVKQQTAPPYNNPTQNYPRGPGQGPGVAYEGQKIQMAPQVKFPGPQQSVRTPFNPNGGMQLNQTNLQNYQRPGAPKSPNDQIQGNTQSAPYAENYKTQIPRDPPAVLSRKPSDVKLISPIVSNQKPNENQLQTGGQLDNISNAVRGDKNSDSLNIQTPISNVTGSTSEPAEFGPTDKKKADLESCEKVLTRDTKTKEKSQKENKSIEDESITSGMVQKNIKFFEENDTSKIPLKPERTTVKKKEKTAVVPPDVVKSDASKNDYESGVDETPVVHPNLGSIFQVPRRVAKIPHLKTSKRLRKNKSKELSELYPSKSRIYQKGTLSDFLKPRRSYLPFKLNSKKAEKEKSYGSKEELLAFFENTKSWRQMKRYESKSDENTSKEKLALKPTTNGDIPTPKKTPSKLQTPTKRNPPISPTRTPLKSPGTPGTPGTKSLPKTPDSPAPSTPLIKKVPMNKIHVGAAPSPNLKTVKSKVGSLANTTHKPGGGNVKIESHKIDLSKVQPRTEAKNDQYKPSGGDKKIQQVKLQWSAKSKVGSLENATYKPSGGDKKIESVKLDFKEKAKPKVGSKDNVKHVPGGGNVKIENQKLEFKAQSKVGSLDNVKHKPGGGDIKIFDDKTYLRQVSGASSEGRGSGTQARSELSIVREVEGRSAPGTPGRRTSVKIKKITTFQSFDETPKVKNVTEVIVTSQTPKKEKKIEKSPTKQQVKVTYSKISTSKGGETADTVGIIKLPANTDAPVLKPSLSKKDLFGGPETGKQTKDNEKGSDSNTFSNVRNTGGLKQSSVSPNLPEGKSNLRDDTGLSKFLKDEIATHEKIGEIWREQNSTENKPNVFSSRQLEEKQKESMQTSFSEDYVSRNKQQFRSQNPEIKTETQKNLNDSQRLNFHSNQNMQYEQFSSNSPSVQSQEQH